MSGVRFHRNVFICLSQLHVNPPSSGSTTPLINLASGPHKKAAALATSATCGRESPFVRNLSFKFGQKKYSPGPTIGLPMWKSNLESDFSTSGPSINAATFSVSMAEGAMALIRILAGAYSNAIIFVSPSNPCFDTA